MKLSGTNLLPILVTLLLGACSTTGGETAGPAGTAAGPVASAEAGGQAADEVTAAPVFDPIKCEKVRPTGTRIPVKVCKKQSEWDAIREAAQRDIQDAQRRGSHQNSTGS